MSPLPLPVRLAAGLVATAVEQARDLPRLVVEFPVTAVSQALQASMRMQQRVTELAIKGDRALGALRPVEEQPSWATFDDEQPAHDEPTRPVTPLRPARTARPVPVERPAGSPIDTAVDVDLDDDAESDDIEPDGAESIVPSDPEGNGVAALTPATTTVDTATDTGPDALPGYAELTIPQLRAKLRTLSLDDLRALLAWEQAHGDRPPFVTMLGNRITTVTER